MAADDLQSKASDLMKKVLTVGVGTLFLTEESLRGLVGEFKLPKELIGSILDSASKTKNEFLQKLTSDILDRVMEKVDPAVLPKQLLNEVIEKNDIEFTVKLSFKPKKTPPKA